MKIDHSSYTLVSSSSCRAASTDIPDPLFSLSFIACGRSLGLHPVSSHSCCMYVRAARPAFARPYVGGPKRYITYELVSASPAEYCMSGFF